MYYFDNVILSYQEYDKYTSPGNERVEEIMIFVNDRAGDFSMEKSAFGIRRDYGKTWGREIYPIYDSLENFLDRFNEKLYEQAVMMNEGDTLELKNGTIFFGEYDDYSDVYQMTIDKYDRNHYTIYYNSNEEVIGVNCMSYY